MKVNNKANDDVPLQLLPRDDLTMNPVIYRDSEDRPDVIGHFMDAIVEVSRKIEKLLKKKILMIILEEQKKTHQE